MSLGILQFPTLSSTGWMAAAFRPDVIQAAADADAAVAKLAMTPAQSRDLVLAFDARIFGATPEQPAAQKAAAEIFTKTVFTQTHVRNFIMAQPWLNGSAPVGDRIRAAIEYSVAVFFQSPVYAGGKPVLPATDVPVPFSHVNGVWSTTQNVACDVYVPLATRMPDGKGGWSTLAAGYYRGNYSGPGAVVLRLWAALPFQYAAAYEFLLGYEYPDAPIFSENESAGNNRWRNKLNGQYRHFNSIIIGQAIQRGAVTFDGLYTFERPDAHFDVRGMVFDIFVIVFTAYAFSAVSAGTSAAGSSASVGSTTANMAKQLVTDPVGFLKARAAAMLSKPVTLVKTFISDPVGAVLDIAHEKLKAEIVKVTGPLGRVYDIYADPAGFIKDKITDEILYPLEHPGDWIMDQAKAQIHNKITGEIRNAITGMMIQPAIISPGVVITAADVSAPVAVETVATVPASAPAKKSGGVLVPVVLIALAWELLT